MSSCLGGAVHYFHKYGMKVTGIIHAGAWHGDEIVDYIANGVKNIAWFEPQQSCQESLLKWQEPYADRAYITIHPQALGNENTTMKMYTCTSFDMTSSLLEPSEVFFRDHPNLEFRQEEEVEVCRLDDYEGLELKDYNCLSMDTQGYELEILKGAVNTLEHVDYIFTEISNEEIYKGTALIEDLDEFLEPRGFKRVETHWQGKGNWGDAFYLKEKQ
tara:strand:+ start:828 stop:1475 length:648 start_codon:yes stop_codon:yes gene_type:complete